jgi:TonB family protein
MGLGRGMGLGRIAVMLAVGAAMGVAHAQQAGEAAPIERRDPAVDAAAEYVGRALFLRCFCAENNLTFDAQGRPMGPVKAEDWTLAAVNVANVERKTPGLIELDGVRVAIRYAADRHEFERHPQNDEKMRITVADTGDPKQMEQALEAVFAVGIDVRLQRAMPDYWQHYFDPKMPWPADDLSTQTIYRIGPGVTPVSATHRAEPSYTLFAQKDHIKGMVQVRVVVDAQGVGRRLSIAQPLGYGLDEKTVEAVEKFRFAPAMSGGKPVASTVVVDQEYVVAPVQQ